MARAPPRIAKTAAFAGSAGRGAASEVIRIPCSIASGPVAFAAFTPAVVLQNDCNIVSAGAELP